VAESNVRLTVDARNAIQQLQRANTATRNLDTSVKGVSRSTATATANVQRFGIAFRSVIGPIVAITGAVNLASRSLKVLGERQADAAALENGLQKVGATSGELERLVGVADRLGKATLFNEEDFTKGFALLTSFQSIGITSYERVAKAAADVAQVTRQDVGSSLLQLAKALQDPERGLTALARSGTQFTDQQKEQIKELVKSNKQLEAQDYILREIERQYGDAAEAAGSAGYAGAVDSLQESFRDFQERLAEGIQPAVTALLGSMAKLFDLVSKVPTSVGQAAATVGLLTGAFIALKKAMESAIGVKIISFITQQIALYRTFGGAIYFAAAAQGAMTKATNLLKIALYGLPLGIVTLAIQKYYEQVALAEARNVTFADALRSTNQEQIKAAIAAEEHTQALIRQRIASEQLCD
jgi:gas vesicle protein